MPKYTNIDIIGKRFGRLTALYFIPDSSKWASFMFKCDCGNTKRILAQSVTSGRSLSCGCYHKESNILRNKTHGHSGKNRTKTYNTWALMMDRCEWGGHRIMWSNYGAKGIKVCERWRKFENFLQDMGERPIGKTLDRIDNAKGYSKENCRWATNREQSLNKVKTPRVRYQGSVIDVFSLRESFGISYSAFNSRAQRRKRDFVLTFKSYGIICEYI